MGLTLWTTTKCTRLGEWSLEKWDLKDELNAYDKCALCTLGVLELVEPCRKTLNGLVFINCSIKLFRNQILRYIKGKRNYTNYMVIFQEVIVQTTYNQYLIYEINLFKVIPLRYCRVGITFIGSLPLNLYKCNCWGSVARASIPSHWGDIHCPTRGSYTFPLGIWTNDVTCFLIKIKCYNIHNYCLSEIFKLLTLKIYLWSIDRSIFLVSIMK